MFPTQRNNELKNMTEVSGMPLTLILFGHYIFYSCVEMSHCIPQICTVTMSISLYTHIIYIYFLKTHFICHSQHIIENLLL
jgi:hypothetical protein